MVDPTILAWLKDTSRGDLSSREPLSYSCMCCHKVDTIAPFYPHVLLAPSGALVFIMVYYIPATTTFPNFSNSSDSKVKVKEKGPNMCYIFEMHWIQGYRI